MTTAICVYQPEIAEFLNAFDKAEFLDFIPEIPIEDIVNDYQPEKESNEPKPQITAIIEAFHQTLKRADMDYDNMTKARFTGRLREDNNLENDIENFYSDRVQLYADEIAQYIRALIQLDNFPSTIFGNWKNVYRAIKESNGKTKSMYLKQLIIYSLTVIPTSIKYEEVVLIEPAITNPERTVRG